MSVRVIPGTPVTIGRPEFLDVASPLAINRFGQRINTNLPIFLSASPVAGLIASTVNR